VTVVEFENLLITSRVHELADADLIFVPFVLLSEDDGVMLASRCANSLAQCLERQRGAGSRPGL